MDRKISRDFLLSIHEILMLPIRFLEEPLLTPSCASPITVGEVTNTNNDTTLAISDAQARLAAAAIAITGRPSGLDGNGNNIWPQYTLYTFG